MGLMLSVLVFCVGVAEILDCWHHFFLHLVQPQYNPLPRHLDLKSDYLSDRELINPISEIRRTSNVDICWPKDLSPDDNLHVIKKRPHGDPARGNEHDLDSSHRVIRKALHHETDISSHLTPTPENVDGLYPDIVVHTPDPTDLNISPDNSRQTSPNRLELGVIVESDSSSEVDEPSQIENINYKKVKESLSLDQEEELKDLFRDQTYQASDVKASEILRPKCPSAMILEDDCNNESTNQIAEKPFESETSSLPELKVFTDSILSLDVQKVNVHHPDSLDTESLNIASRSCDSVDNRHTQLENVKDLKNIESNTLQQHTETNSNTSILPISAILDEGLEPISEFPEIKVQESSPIPQLEDSDSSLNTSDASWMVRSKTSDRPLIIRFETSPEKVQQDFQSVVQTDLRALGNKEHQENKCSSIPLEKADSVDIYYDALVNQNNGDGTGENPGDLQCDVRLQENADRSEKLVNDEVFNEPDVKPQSVNFMALESNSSSSSLSGIPPLPEDTLESLSQTSLATDNGFSQMSDIASTKTSDSNIDTSAMSMSTSDKNRNENCNITQPKSNVPSGDPTDIHVASVETNIDRGISSTEVQSTSSINNSIGTKEEVSVDNIQNVKGTLEEQNILKVDNKDKKDSFFSTKNKSSQPAVAPEDSVPTLKRIDEAPPGLNVSGADSSCQENVKKNESKISKDERDQPNNKEKSLESVQKQTPSKELTGARSSNEKPSTSKPLESSQPPLSTLSPATTPSIDENDKANIPIPLQESDNLTKSEIETSVIAKEKTAKKQKTKSSSKNSSTDSSDTVVPCRAKVKDEEKHVENQAESASVKTIPSSSGSVLKTDLPVEPGPSKPSTEPTPSTSKSEEDKAFWLIFSGEYTKAMNKDWHSNHFCCWQCDESLTGQRYVLRDEHPYCVKCYESVFANGCEECSKTIGIDSKDLSYKDKHWHEACFLCNKCRVSLVDKQFGSKLDKIFCGNCYDQQFASRCDGCGQIFKAGTKKMEYKTRQWHEPCFSCCVCKSPIGTKSFIPREQEIYCATCYEEKFATRCVKCNKIITSGGVTYKNEPWHRECFTCTHCNASLAGQRFTSRDEKPYCADCFGELFAKRCTACSKPITGIGGTRFISFEDRHWHNDCFICASCKTSLVGRGFITDGDDIICPECAKQKLM